MKSRFLLLLLLGVHWLPLAAQQVEVRLEPFPPLVNEDGSGLAVELLAEVEKVSGLEFNIRIMPYSRAKHEVRMGAADMLGPVPLGKETDEFYEWALELDWHFDTRSDLFVLDAENLHPGKLESMVIGVPRGNSGFFSELTGVPRDRFRESGLTNLARMLATGRVDALLFERASTFDTLARLNIEGVHYRNLFSIPAGFALHREHGVELAERLDAALKEIDPSPVTSTYEYFLGLPDQGVVSLSRDKPVQDAQ